MQTLKIELKNIRLLERDKTWKQTKPCRIERNMYKSPTDYKKMKHGTVINGLKIKLKKTNA